MKVYFVKYENQADLKIYFVDYENQAGWRNSSKKKFNVLKPAHNSKQAPAKILLRNNN